MPVPTEYRLSYGEIPTDLVGRDLPDGFPVYGFWLSGFDPANLDVEWPSWVYENLAPVGSYEWRHRVADAQRAATRWVEKDLTFHLAKTVRVVGWESPDGDLGSYFLPRLAVETHAVEMVFAGDVVDPQLGDLTSAQVNEILSMLEAGGGIYKTRLAATDSASRKAGRMCINLARVNWIEHTVTTEQTTLDDIRRRIADYWAQN